MGNADTEWCLCRYCVEAIKSHGEPLYVCDIIWTGEDELIACDWCGELYDEIFVCFWKD